MKKLFVFLFAVSALFFVSCDNPHFSWPDFQNEFQFETGAGVPFINFDSSGVCVSGAVNIQTNSETFLDSLTSQGITFSNDNVRIHLSLDSSLNLKVDYKTCVAFKKKQ